VYGRRVRQARRIRRHSVSAVAEAVGIRQPRLSELEHAYASELPGDTLRRLGEVLDFPVPFFSAEPWEPVHPGTLLFRAKSTLADADADLLAEYAGAAGEIFSALSQYATSPPVRLPDLRQAAEPSVAARIVREQLGIKTLEPIDNLVRKAERAGILVIALSFDFRLHDRLDAFSCWAGEYADRPVTALRASSPWDRRRWSLAHERGHAVLHRRNRDGDIEAQANQFASEFLLPSAALAEDWPASPTIMSLLPLKEKWGLSIQALAEHGFRASLLDDSRRMSLYKQLSNRKWTDGTRWREREPGWDLREPELPRMLGKMAEVGLGLGTDVGLDSVSRETGHWPVLFLQELLGIQLARSGERGGRRPPAPAVPGVRPRVISLADWRRAEAGQSEGGTARATAGRTRR
jgi:Zn-dependent peptidase ImmA (M78 family)